MANDSTYTRGFNHGYLIAVYVPLLSKALADAGIKKTTYVKGLLSGIDEGKREKIKKRSKKIESLKRNRNKGYDRNR